MANHETLKNALEQYYRGAIDASDLNKILQGMGPIAAVSKPDGLITAPVAVNASGLPLTTAPSTAAAASVASKPIRQFKLNTAGPPSGPQLTLGPPLQSHLGPKRRSSQQTHGQVYYDQGHKVLVCPKCDFDMATGRKRCGHVDYYLSSETVINDLLHSTNARPTTRTMNIFIAEGLIRAQIIFSFERHPRDEGRIRLMAVHKTAYRREQETLVRFELDTTAGDTLMTAVRAVENYYENLPEYLQYADKADEFFRNVPCADPGHRSTLGPLPEEIECALTWAEDPVRAQILANTFVRHNDAEPHPCSGCYWCFVRDGMTEPWWKAPR